MSGFDKQVYFQLLCEDPLAAQDYALDHSQKVSQVMEDYQGVRNHVVTNAVNQAFVKKHPELLQVTPEEDLQNAQKLAEILRQNNLPYTAENLEIALDAAKESGEVTLGAGGETIRAPNGQFVSKKEFDRTAPLDQLREFYESKYPDRVRR